MSSSGTSLRRSCQACVKVKRRCDLLYPECSRCLKKGVRCSYTNIPLSNRTGSLGDGRVTKPVPIRQQQQPRPQPYHNTVLPMKAKADQTALATRHIITDGTEASDSSDENDVDHALWIRPALDMEIQKHHPPYIVNMISEVVRQAPRSFVQGGSFFIHPCLYGRSLPRPVQDMRDLCSMYENGRDSNDHLSAQKRRILLHRQIVTLQQSAKEATGFENLVACVQALTLAQCIQLSEGNINGPGIEKSLNSLAALACKMWSTVPHELPNSMSPWRAWVFAETVRRTIVFSHLVIAAFSFLSRGYATRTPFIDALPFDGRTYLWDARSEDEWTKSTLGTHMPMVSLSEYADLLQSGRALCFSPFEHLIIATCRGLDMPIHNPLLVFHM